MALRLRGVSRRETEEKGDSETMKVNLLKFWRVLLTGILLTGSALANPHRGEDGDRPLLPDRVLDRIGLTEDQIAEVQRLREDHKATMGPLWQQGEEIRIDLQDLRQQIQESRHSLREAFEALLTPEQLEQIQEFRERRGERESFRRSLLGRPSERPDRRDGPGGRHRGR